MASSSLKKGVNSGVKVLECCKQFVFSRELNTSHSSEDQHDWAVDKPEGESQPVAAAPAAATAPETTETKYVNAAYITWLFQVTVFLC